MRFIFSIIFIISIAFQPVFGQLSGTENEADQGSGDVASILYQKAGQEGFSLYLQPSWFQQVELSSELRELTLLPLLERLLPPLKLRLIRFEPNHLVVTRDLLDRNGERASENGFMESGPEETYQFDPTRRFAITGTLVDNKTGEPVIGGTVFVRELESGTITNEFGVFNLTLPSALYHITVSALGYEPEDLRMALLSDTAIQVTLFDKSTQLQEIIIYDEAEDQNVTDITMGTTRINLETLKKIPPMMGEVDVLRSLMLLPGVTTVGEGATGFNVRGGSVDQNQILIDEAPVFNPSHFFGFFSSFNSKAIKDLTISKGGIPAQYGGRISSILDVKIRQGNTSRFRGEGGIGLLSSNLMLDGPIWQDRTSFLVSGRVTYSDWFLNFIPDSQISNSQAYFHDFIGKVSHEINTSNHLSLTGYTSNDQFKFPGDSIYGWSNHAATLKWSKGINPRVLMVNSLVFSNYNYNVFGTEQENAFKWTAGIEYFGWKSDYSFTPNLNHKTDAGIHIKHYRLQLGDLEPDSDGSNVNAFRIDPETAIESALYLNHEFRINSRITLMGGLRYSHFLLLGPGTTFIYDPDRPKSRTSIIDEESYGSGEIIQQYGGPEPRISFRYGFGRHTSLKFSYNRMRQYIHLISNTSAVSPVDIWKLSDSYLKPQTGDQLAAGIFRNFRSNTYETSLEVFYKKIDNSYDYKDGANLVLNRNLERELVAGTIRAYGAELLIRKNKGRLQGWVAYTLSRAERQVNGAFPEETINQGQYYPVNYDKLHDLAVVGNYDFSRRYSLGFNYVLYSGRPISYPTGSYGVGGFLIPNFEIRNQERIPAYHRLDVSFTIDGNHKKDKRWHGSWTFSVYNLYGRKNPYSIFFKARGFKVAQAYRLAVIGAAIPSVTYNFKF